MHHEDCREILRALLNCAFGRLGRFVPVTDVVAASGLDNEVARAALDAAASRRWCYVRRGSAAASRWGLEVAMDWTQVPALLRVILNSAGGINRAAQQCVVVAANGLPDRLVHTLCEELSVFGLAGWRLIDRERVGPCVTPRGWAYLVEGGSAPLPVIGQATGSDGLLDSP